MECRQYLIDRLQQAGYRSPVMHSYKKLASHQGSHVGAVLFEKESFKFNGSKTVYTAPDGSRHKRTCYLDRTLTFIVVVGEFSAEAVEDIFIKFLLSLERGLYVDGNYVYLDIKDAEWSEDADSSLKAKVQRLVSITFTGGVYKDTPLSRRTGGVTVRVEKAPFKREEQTDGKS